MANNKREDTHTPCADLFDKISKQFGVPNDAHLARFLKMEPPIISKLRHGITKPSGDNLIRIHLATTIPMTDLIEATDYQSTRAGRGRG